MSEEAESRGLDPLMIPRAYDIFIFNDGQQGEWLGGAPDAVSACNMAASYFGISQVLNPRVGIGVGVVGAQEAGVVAYIGWHTEEV